MNTIYQSKNMESTSDAGISSNDKVDFDQIVPERFNSISQPTSIPIVLPELNSISEPKLGAKK